MRRRDVERAVGVDETVTAGTELRKPPEEIEATVVELLPSLTYRVELDGKEQLLAHAVGTAERNFVRLRPGDRVVVEVSPHDRTRGRIVRLVKGYAAQRDGGEDR